MNVCVFAEPASTVLQRAPERKEPCINWIPADTIFSEGDTFQRMC